MNVEKTRLYITSMFSFSASSNTSDLVFFSLIFGTFPHKSQDHCAHTVIFGYRGGSDTYYYKLLVMSLMHQMKFIVADSL